MLQNPTALPSLFFTKMADLHNDVIMQAIVSGLGTSIHGVVVQEMDGNIVIGHSIYGNQWVVILPILQ